MEVKSSKGKEDVFKNFGCDKEEKMRNKKNARNQLLILFATIMMTTIMMMMAIVPAMAEGVVANASCNDTYWDSQMSIPSTAAEFNATGELPAMAKDDVWVSSADEIRIWPSEAPGPPVGIAMETPIPLLVPILPPGSTMAGVDVVNGRSFLFLPEFLFVSKDMGIAVQAVSYGT